MMERARIPGFSSPPKGPPRCRHPAQAPRRSESVLAALLALALIVGLGSLAVSQVEGPAAKPKPETAADPLVTLNNTSRMLYTLAKQNALARSGPVMIVVGDDLVLRNGEKRVQARVIPEIYHTLKTFDHITLAIDVTLAAAGDGDPIPEDVLRELREYRALLPPARERISASGLDAEQRERQKAIVDACGEFLDSILEQRKCSAAKRIQFMRRMSPLVMANASAAARARLDALQHQIVAWSKSGDLTPQVMEPADRARHRPSAASQGQPRRPVFLPPPGTARRGRADHLRRGARR